MSRKAQIGNKGKPETRGAKRAKHFCVECKKNIFATAVTWKLHLERHRQAMPAPENG